MQAELFEQDAMLMTNDESLAEIYKDLLATNGYKLELFPNISSVIKAVNDDTRVIIMDLDNEDMNIVFRAIKNIKTKFQNIVFVGISIYPPLKRFNYSDIFDSFLVKPIHLDNLIKAIFCIKKYNNELV